MNKKTVRCGLLIIFCGSVGTMQPMLKKAAIGFLASTPTLYYGKKCYDETHKYYRSHNDNTFKGYINGVLSGAIPGVNAFPIIIEIVNMFHGWSHDEQLEAVFYYESSSPLRHKGYRKGLYAAASAYITIPLMFKILGKIRVL